MAAELKYSCPRCGSHSDMEDFEARPVFDDGQLDCLELVVESWCDGCEAGSLFTDEVPIDAFVDKLTDFD